MKNLRIAVVALFATAAVSAQDLSMSDVPSNLTDSFQQAYPDVTDIEWEMDGMNYKVEFDKDRMEHEIWYNKDGQTVRMEQELTESDLPEAINLAIKSKYDGFSIDSVEMTEMDGKKTYEVELEKGWDTEKKVVFDSDGKVVKEWND